jgi:DNA-binding IclR family transcriptional regulator
MNQKGDLPPEEERKIMIGYQAPAVQKAFQLLKTVAEAPEGLGLVHISEHLGFSKATTHGLVQALLKVGALDQSPYKKKLFIGASFVELANKTKHYYGIAEQAQPILDKLGEKIYESAFLGITNHKNAIIIAVSRAARPLGISSSPGATVPLLSGAVGKAFLASLKKNNVLKIIRRNGLQRFTPKTIVDEPAYLDELNAVRQNGYALDDEEYLAGVRAIAISLGNCRGLPLLIWVAGLTATMGDAKLSGIIKETLTAADGIKRLLLKSPDPRMADR